MACRERSGLGFVLTRAEEMLEIIYMLGGVSLGTVIWLWILRRYDRIEPESIRHLVQVGLVGGLVSIVAAALLNEMARIGIGLDASIFEDASSASAMRLLMFCVAVGLVEEICKAVATVTVTRKLGNLDEPVDAMVYAMTVALCFASFENIFYAMRFGNEVLLARFLWPVPAHMAYAALWGYGLAWARFVHPDRSRAAVMAPSVAAAGIIHAAANFLLFLQETVTATISLMALAALAILAHLRLKKLVAESPFLQPGECVECRFVNAPHALICAACDVELETTEIFVTCPCGQARVPSRLGICPSCGDAMRDAEVKRIPQT